MTTTGLVTSPLSALHDPGSGHPERAERLAAIAERLEASGMLSELHTAEASLAPTEALLRIHPEAYLNHVEATVASGAGHVDSTDANVCTDSYRAARGAAGGALLAVDRVLAGEWDNAFVAVRPPGHHAESGFAMGFCLLNSAAIAVRHAQSVHGLERVAVVDWDVHHGNGTQHLFEADGSVLYASLHQYPHYPGTGAASERGSGAGEGTTLNCPQPAGSGDVEWLADFEQLILPELESFDPELVIVSAGFDAHALDPLSDTRLTEEAYRAMTRGILDLARERCAGRVVSLLEGGYSLDGLARSVEAHLGELRLG
jgi:acetoin utilization deacetylase AcuC-like enzyme